MISKENPHAGHRERLVNRFFENPDSFSDHELLEMLLFPLIPRKNTNGIAHAILDYFGTVEKVFSATAEELTAIEGIGKKVAAELSLIGKIYKKIYDRNKYLNDIKWTTFGMDKHRYIEFFDGYRKEVLLLLLIDDRGREITRLTITNDDSGYVSAAIPKISKIISINKPYGIILAHNHPSGIYQPSKDDDKATAKILSTCEIHGVKFLDHVIVAGRNAYSYRNTEWRMDFLEESFNLNAFFEGIDYNLDKSSKE